jgi:hypothetical protein
MHYKIDLVGGENGIKDITGRTLEDTYMFEFYTKDVIEIKPPVLLSPTHLSEYYTDASYDWHPVEQAEYYEMQISKSNTFHTLEWPQEPVKIYDNFFTPDLSHERGNYYVRIRSVTKDGVRSAYSPVLQYFYDDTPDIEILEEPQIGIKEEKDLARLPKVKARKRVNIQANTEVQQNHELSSLQQHFIDEQNVAVSKLYLKSTSPKHVSLNVSLDQLKEIVIEFSEELNPSDITNETCYLISERN